MLEWLESADKSLFLLLNGWRVHWLDLPMFFVTKGWLWTPVFLLLLLRLLRRFPTTWERLLIAAGIVVCLGGTDLISSEAIKPNVQRLRPVHDQGIGPRVHTVRGPRGRPYRGGPFGFVSSHAANYFGLATLCYRLLGNRRFLWLFAWASLVAYSRIYLGVHYPGDIVGGALLGVAWGAIVFYGLQAALVVARRRFPARTTA